MSRKFDVVIGNPPYQEEATGTATHNMPIYHRFMDAAYEVAQKAVLITPARFLFNAGYTPKEWNARMLADPHLSVEHYAPNSDDLFPGTEIMGGIAITYRDAEREGEAIGTFAKYPELNTILHKVQGAHEESIDLSITSARDYRYTQAMHDAFPEATDLMSDGHQWVINTRTFELLSFLFHDAPPEDGKNYSQVLGLAGRDRTVKWIRSDLITGPTALEKYKVAVPAARNAGGMLGDKPALVTGYSLLVSPRTAVTQTFITIGAFDTQSEGEACLKYIQSRFARVLLGILKVTQHNPRSTWKHVPNQDFTEASDIDWSKSIPEIDAQLYAKYGLDSAEIAFIQSHVKPME